MVNTTLKYFTGFILLIAFVILGACGRTDGPPEFEKVQSIAYKSPANADSKRNSYHVSRTREGFVIRKVEIQTNVYNGGKADTTVIGNVSAAKTQNLYNKIRRDGFFKLPKNKRLSNQNIGEMHAGVRTVIVDLEQQRHSVTAYGSMPQSPDTNLGRFLNISEIIKAFVERHSQEI